MIAVAGSVLPALQHVCGLAALATGFGPGASSAGTAFSCAQDPVLAEAARAFSRELCFG